MKTNYCSTKMKTTNFTLSINMFMKRKVLTLKDDKNI